MFGVNYKKGNCSHFALSEPNKVYEVFFCANSICIGAGGNAAEAQPHCVEAETDNHMLRPQKQTPTTCFQSKLSCTHAHTNTQTDGPRHRTQTGTHVRHAHAVNGLVVVRAS